MKPFYFTLERLRTYKKQLLDREKNTLAVLRRELMDAESRLNVLERELTQENMAFQSRQRRGVTGLDIQCHRFSRENGLRRREELEEVRREAAEAVGLQLAAVVAATQEVSSLDKLAERQLENYQIEESRDREKIISEFVSTQVIRSRRA